MRRLPGDSRAEWARHWRVGAAAMAGVAMSTINVYSLGLFLDPLGRTFGWSRAEVTGGQLLPALATGVLAPFAGAAIDRYGARRIGIAGVIGVAVATALLGLTGPRLWTWYAVWTLLAAINVLLQPSVWTAGVSGFFAAGRGFALAVTLCGSGLGSLVSPVLTFALIERFGWRLAYLGLSAFWLALVLPVVLAFFTSPRDIARSRPAPAPAPPREGLRDLADPRFVQLALAAFLIAAVVVPFATSLVPILGWTGLSRGRAAAVAGLLGVSSIAGRLLVGYLLDRIDGRLLAALTLCLPVAASLLIQLAPGSVPLSSAAVLLLGASLGAELDLVAYLTSRYFGLERFGLLFGSICGLVTLAGGVGPWVLSLVYDTTGGYRAALVAYVPACLVAALLFVLLGPYPPPAPDAEATG